MNSSVRRSPRTSRSGSLRDPNHRHPRSSRARRVTGSAYWSVTDPTGENIEPLEIGTISSLGIVECVPNSVHEYQTNDYITFTNLEGTNLDYFKSEYQIEIINKKSFQLKNFNHSDFTFKNGTA
ncbi:MAG: hypothetical protein EB020_08415, partial [Proteobacteria bacterium]|nr:hypothetical protein [Pseudomonadota bacterium]